MCFHGTNWNTRPRLGDHRDKQTHTRRYFGKSQEMLIFGVSVLLYFIVVRCRAYAKNFQDQFDGLVQDCSIPTALAIKILQSCTKPLCLIIFFALYVTNCSSLMIYIHCHVTLISTINHCKLANWMCATKYYTVVPLRLSFMPVLDLYVILISVFFTLFWFLFEFSVIRLDRYISWHLMLPNHFWQHAVHCTSQPSLSHGKTLSIFTCVTIK